MPATQGYFDGYDPQCDPSIANAFAAAAYRFGHTLIQSDLEMRDAKNRMFKVINLQNVFFNPDNFYEEPGYCDAFLKGMCGQPVGAFDK